MFLHGGFRQTFARTVDSGRPLPRTGSSARTKVERITQYAVRLICDERNMGMGIISILTKQWGYIIIVPYPEVI